LALVPDDRGPRPELKDGFRRIRVENIFDDAAWEKNSASEHALRVRVAALELEAETSRTKRSSRPISPVRPSPGVCMTRTTLHWSLSEARLLDRAGSSMSYVPSFKPPPRTRRRRMANHSPWRVWQRTHLFADDDGRFRARSSVIEIFYPEGFTHNYERTTRVLGMKHFDVWNDTSVRQLEHPCVAYRNGFQNTNIPVLAHALIGCGPCRRLYLSRLLPSLGSVLLSSSISHSHSCIQYLRSLHFNFSYHPASCSSTSARPVCVGSMP
jgi:hypothetical protein